MIMQEPTKEMLEEAETVWLEYKDKLTPNRKSGSELLDYLQHKYILTEIYEKDAAEAVICNVIMNVCYATKLPEGKKPVPRTFFLENIGNGKVLYSSENKDSANILGDDISKIFVGIDTVTGFFMVEGSSLLYDEMNAFRGLDEIDLKNMICVSEYISALQKFDLLKNAISK